MNRAGALQESVELEHVRLAGERLGGDRDCGVAPDCTRARTHERFPAPKHTDPIRTHTWQCRIAQPPTRNRQPRSHIARRGMGAHPPLASQA